MTPAPATRSGGTTGAPARHIPVLLAEVLAALAPANGGVYIDGTFGAAGYTRAILETPDAQVIAIDRDATAIAAGRDLVSGFSGRLTLIEGRFSEMDRLAADVGKPVVDGVVLDVGVSSMQIDTAARGFSFQADGPLDMRMGPDATSAADIVNTASEAHLADLLFHLGEEPRSRAIARAIVRARAEAPLTRTSELARLVEKAVGGRRGDPIHPATRTFQALRIAVNDELGELARGLSAAERILKPGGRLVVVTFHSLEDRIVKRFLAERGGRKGRGSRHLPEPSIELKASSFRLVNPKPLSPQKGELDANPRASSARLRAAERTEAEAWPLDLQEVGVPFVAE